ncbi:hypothetical protein [Sinosporangium siamense]|nr:hypothetical protein [Sinosporangium siamense]
MRLTSKVLAVGVTISGPGYLDLLTEIHGLTTVQQVTYRGHPLLITVDSANENWTVGWTGAHHTLTLGGSLPAPGLDLVVGLMDQLTIEDHPDGMVVSPLPGSGIVMWSVSGVMATGAGPMTLYRRDEAHALIPTQPGARVQNGEVWKKGLEIGERTVGYKYVHVGADAVCMIDDRVGKIPGITAQSMEDVLSSLSVQWER